VKFPVSLAIITLALAAHAQDSPPADAYFVADIELQTAEDFMQVMDRAEQFLLRGEPLPEGNARVTLVLHGPVLRSLLRQNYLQNKALVDKAASLSALGVIDLKACNTWMTGNGIEPQHLQPFIEVIAYGPAEVKRLVRDEHYLYF